MAVERELKKTSPVLKEFEAMLEKDFSSRKLREKEIVFPGGHKKQSFYLFQ